MNGRESDLDHFPFFLARELGQTLEEIGNTPQADIVAWRAYYTAKHAMENRKVVQGAGS